ncbi:hypothetical protein V5O48_000757 [Marasmius crinis-equi]|uniref:BTB domain-containing protein n=1 Tax=Marasmius crinis-equi TaxID=585013 RepID=A0ABR3G0A5_9AGAR
MASETPGDLPSIGGTTISSTWGPNSTGVSRPPVDIVLFTSDAVAFYVDEATLLQASNNSFRTLLPITTEDNSQRVLFMTEMPSVQLDIMLQVVYNAPSAATMLDIQTLMRAINQLPVYGILPSTHISPTSHLYQHLLARAPLHPLEIYALAAQYNMEILAMTVSSHTLTVELSQLSEDLARRMGSVYLLRLFQLHAARTDALKRLLAAELGLHDKTPSCDFDAQKRLRNGWNMAVASMLFDIKPGQSRRRINLITTLYDGTFMAFSLDTTTTMIRATILEHTSNLICPDCIKLRDTNLARVIRGWVETGVSIGF